MFHYLKSRHIHYTHDSVELMKQIEKRNSGNNNVPKCPTCQSTNLHKISTTSKAMNTVVLGLLGTKRHKTFHCNNCGYEW